MPRSIDFSRATASAICSSSSLLALTAMVQSPLIRIDLASARAIGGEAMFLRIRRERLLGRLLVLRLFLALRRLDLCRGFGTRPQWRRQSEVAIQRACGGFPVRDRF